MAVLGFFDADVMAHSPVPFNLELMKLASYYSSRRHICVFLLNPFVDKYTKVFYRKDYNDGAFPKMLYKADNISYGGHAFSGSRYVPLKEDIEKAFPDPSIYERVRTPYANTRKDAELYFNRYKYASHLRISLDGETVWADSGKYIDYEGRNTLIMLHDYNLDNIKDSHLFIKELMSAKDRGIIRLGSKFPVQIKNADVFRVWAELPWSTKDFPVRYVGKIEDEEFAEISDLFYHRKRHVRQIEFFVPALADSAQEFLEKEIVKLYRRMVFARENKFPVRLIVPPNYFLDSRWVDVIKVFEVFASSGFEWKENKNLDFQTPGVAPRTLYSFARNARPQDRRTEYDVFSREELREIFKFVADNHYELFKEFYETDNLILKGGVIVER